MSVVRKVDTNIVPMPSRIEITFDEFLEGTNVPNVDKPTVKFMYQEYDAETGKSVKAGILQLKHTELLSEDFDNIINFFVKHFDKKYKEKFNIKWGEYEEECF